MHTMTLQQRTEQLDQFAFYCAKYSLIIGIAATIAYSLAGLI